MRRKLATLALTALAAACGAAPPVPETPAAPAAPSTPALEAAPSAPAAQSAPAAAPRVAPPLLDTHLTPEALTAACAAAEQALDARIAKLVATPPEALTFAASFGEAEAATGEYVEAVSRLQFLKNIHADAKVREAGAACEERSGKYMVVLSARKDLYDALKGAQGRLTANGAAPLGLEERRLVEFTMRDFRRAGLELPEAQRKELTTLRERLSELESRFHTHLGEDKTKFEVSEDDLAGLPADFLARHERTAAKKVVLTTKYPDFYPVMENATREATRRLMQRHFDNRQAEANLPLINEAVKVRAQIARLLGYAHHLDFVTEPKMSHDGKTVQAFLDRMRTGLKPGLAALTEKMRALKAAETKNPKAVINAWDWRFYLSALRKRDFAVDDEAVRAYLPAPKVVAGLFQIYERIFGVRFVEVPGAEVWAEGVKLYEMRDAAAGDVLARFYMDMYPRDGKYGHAAEFNLAAGQAAGGGYRTPLSVLVVNFEPPAGGKVAHLSVDEVETLFHEFGHVMHESLTVARYPSLAGSSVARDFVEAPSQMLENWVYQPEVLALVSEDPKAPGQGMPKELVDRIVRARNFDAGVAFSRQVFLGQFDVAIHTIGTGDRIDVDAVAHRLWADSVGYPEDRDTHFAATFGHMMGGYDGGYYGYLWSLVFAADMFTRFQAEGIFNPDTGRDYREKVLSRGRIEDADVLLSNFLGRAPTEAAFLKQLGIEAPPAAR